MTYRPQPGMSVRTGNAMMIANIMQMPEQPYREGTAALRVLEVQGRISGETRTVPIGVPQWHGVQYLVSPTRAREWVRNLLAAGECTLVSASRREQMQARLASPEEATPVVMAYVAQMAQSGADFAVNQFPFSVGAGADDVRATLDTMAIFRLDPLPTVPGDD